MNLQDKTLKKYKILEINFGHIFCGDLPEFEISKKIMKMAVTSPKTESKSQNKVMKKVKRQETIHKYFKSPGKGEVASKRSLSPDKQKPASRDLTPQAKRDRPPKKQPNLSLGKQDSKKKLLLSSKKDTPKKNFGVGKYENSGNKLSTLQQKQEKSPKKRFPSETSSDTQKPSPTKKAPKKFNPEFGVKSPHKQQLAKKVKDKYRDAGNMKKRGAAKKNLLEKHKMNKMASLKQEMNDRFVLTNLSTLSV